MCNSDTINISDGAGAQAAVCHFELSTICVTII